MILKSIDFFCTVFSIFYIFYFIINTTDTIYYSCIQQNQKESSIKYTENVRSCKNR